MTTWTATSVKSLFAASDVAVQDAITDIFQTNQTSDEQATEETRHDNGIGFNGFDASTLSSFANRLLGQGIDFYGNPNRVARNLTGPQMHVARKMMGKYAAQYAKLLNAAQVVGTVTVVESLGGELFEEVAVVATSPVEAVESNVYVDILALAKAETFETAAAWNARAEFLGKACRTSYDAGYITAQQVADFTTAWLALNPNPEYAVAN